MEGITAARRLECIVNAVRAIQQSQFRNEDVDDSWYEERRTVEEADSFYCLCTTKA